MVGKSGIQFDLVASIVKDIIGAEGGVFINQKVNVLIYNEKRVCVRSPDYAIAVQHKWTARKQRRILCKEIQNFNAETTTKRL